MNQYIAVNESFSYYSFNDSCNKIKELNLLIVLLIFNEIDKIAL